MEKELINKDTFVLLYSATEATLIHASRLNDDIAKHQDGETPIIIDLETSNYDEAKTKYDDWHENQ